AKPLAGQKSWSSTSVDPAIADFVHIVMALPTPDPRATDAQNLLKDHFTQATQQGASAADALKSTFVVSCLAPSTVAIGLQSRGAKMITRRDALMPPLFGAGYAGLRALATGLPAAFLLDPARALADDPAPACTAKDKAQFIIMSTSGSGDPINSSVP